MKPWLKGLVFATVSGAASSASVLVVDPAHFGLDNLRHLGVIAGVGALTGLIGYLKQSPLK